jgi:HEAT repeat protein
MGDFGQVAALGRGKGKKGKKASEVKMYPFGMSENGSHLLRPVSLAILCAITVCSITGCCDQSALPKAMRNLSSSDVREKNRALQIIAQCGSRGEAAVPRIIQLMYDDNVGVASSAAYALRKIDSKEARAALRRAEEARKGAHRK